MRRIAATALESTSRTGRTIPCLQVLPIGASFDVSLSQFVTSTTVSRVSSVYRLVAKMREVVDHLLDKAHAALVYTDDVNRVVSSPSQINRFMEDTEASLTDSALPTRTEKRIKTGDGPSRDALGLSR